MDHLTDQNYKNEHNEIKYLNNIPKNRFYRIKRQGNKNWEGIRRAIFKQINISIDDMDKLEEKKSKKRPFAKSTWDDWLINSRNHKNVGCC